MKISRHILALVGSIAMIAAASLSGLQPVRAAMMMMGSISLVSPAPGTVVTGTTVPVTIAAKNIMLSCKWAGKAPRNGEGHWHLILDGALVNMYCGATAQLSLQNVAPGKHTITAVLAANNHMEMMGKGEMASTTFIYKPAKALPVVTAYKAPGKPTIRIVSPANGAIVGEQFQITLGWTNFKPSCTLLGKKNLAGYGHWHLNIDSMNGPMMGMGTMMAMGCTRTYTVYTDRLTPGVHKLYALLVDNQHAPLMPGVMAMTTINVKAPTTAAVTTAPVVTIVNDPTTVGRYSQATVTLKMGQTVVFKNVSDAAHTVTADNGAFDSGNIAQGASWSLTATAAGTFTYHCIYHPLMRGMIVVTR